MDEAKALKESGFFRSCLVHKHVNYCMGGTKPQEALRRGITYSNWTPLQLPKDSSKGRKKEMKTLFGPRWWQWGLCDLKVIALGYTKKVERTGYADRV